MPDWLLEINQQELTDEEKAHVANKVAKAGEEHYIQTVRVIPTEIEMLTRFG